MDYANSVLYGTSTSNINKLQRVQNTLAKVVVNNKSCFSAEALHQLHWQWLPIKQHIDLISTITYRILQSGLPSYLSHTIHYHIPSRTVRSDALHFLHVPRIRTTIGHKAFSFASPSIWNSIPLHIRQLTSFNSFKRHLKTHLFQITT